MTTARHESEESALPGEESKRITDPNRFFLHTKHILNRIEEASFASPVLVRPNTQDFGHLYHFPPLAQPARLAGQGDAPHQGETRAPSEIVASVLAKARKPVTAPPLCDPSPPCKALHSKPKPELLSLGQNTWFATIREHLTVREDAILRRLNQPLRKQGFEKTRYWRDRFKKLYLGDFLHMPPNCSTATLRRWVKVLYLQQALAHHKRQLDLDLVTANQLEQPVRETTVNALTTQFRSRTHQCGMCEADVAYSSHLDNKQKKVVDIVQMACSNCSSTKIWTSLQASVLWGIPRYKLKDIPHWNTSNEEWFTTEDLYEAWIQMDLSHRKLDPQLISPEFAQRYKDLPSIVQQTVQAHTCQDNSHPNFDIESNRILFDANYDLEESKDDKEAKGAASKLFPPIMRGTGKSSPPIVRHQGLIYWLTYDKRQHVLVDKNQFEKAPEIYSHSIFSPGDEKSITQKDSNVSQPAQKRVSI